MKAVILAGGKASKLKTPFSTTRPIPMLRLAGRDFVR